MADMDSVHGAWVECVVDSCVRRRRMARGAGGALRKTGRSGVRRTVRGELQRPRAPIPTGYVLAYYASTRACLPR